MSFRQKLLFSQFLLLLALITVLLPLLSGGSEYILQQTYKIKVKKFVDLLKVASSQKEMIQIINSNPEFLLNGALFKNDGTLVHELSQTTRLADLSKESFDDWIKVNSSTHEKVEYDKIFFSVSVTFTSHGETYLLYAVFPAYKMNDLKKAFDLTILSVCVGLLVLNGFLIMAVIHRVMRPVQQIIDAIGPYKEGKEEFLPRIELKNPSKEFAKLASTFNSLTDQIHKQIDFLTLQKEETEEILESIVEGIIAADPSAKVIFANSSACRTLGVLQEQILGKTLESVEEDPNDILKKCHELIIQALQTSEPVRYTWMRRNKKWPLYHELISTPLAHKDGSILVIQDKTSDYRIVEVGKDFIANASHELKTPITIIRGFAETLQDLPQISERMLQEITEKIVKTCMRLDHLVKSLLTLTDIENLSEENFVKVELISLVENCVQMLLSVHSNTKVYLHSKIEKSHVLADGQLLELAIMNILENAVKYSIEPAKIDIEIELRAHDIAIKIKDQGIGISEEELPQIFERFYTVDKARSRKKGGAGLGLSIVKTIVEKHRGKIFVLSELGKGTEFIILLPLF